MFWKMLPRALLSQDLRQSLIALRLPTNVYIGSLLKGAIQGLATNCESLSLDSLIFLSLNWETNLKLG